MTFAAVATRLAGLAARVLGWRPHEFWAATPAELASSLGSDDGAETPPSRPDLMTMMERDPDVRSA